MAGESMRKYLAASVLTTAMALAVLSLAVTPAAQGQQGTGKKDEPKIIRPKAGSPPAPRLPDGHVDLGNGKGSWNAYVIKDFTGHGWGDQGVAKQFERGPQLVEKIVE